MNIADMINSVAQFIKECMINAFWFFIMEDVQSVDQIGTVKACLGISLFMVFSVSLINLLVWIIRKEYGCGGRRKSAKRADMKNHTYKTPQTRCFQPVSAAKFIYPDT